MDIEKLKIFLKVSQYGSFKKVAELEFKSQRAISKQVKQLETDLGVTLFFRKANRITLTPQGQFFLSVAQDMVNNYSNALSELQEFNQQAHQSLRVGYFSAFEEKLLRSGLYKLKKANPTLHLTIREQSNEHLTQSIIAGNLDTALSIDYGRKSANNGPHLQTKTIFSGEMVMGISTLNPKSHKDALLPADLQTEKPILYYSPESSTFLLESFLASMPFITNYERIQRVTSVEQMGLLVAMDQAYAFYPAGLLNEDLLVGDSHIKLLPVRQAPSQGYEIVMMYREDNDNPALANLLEAFK